jgi:hypothetical protein
MHENEDFCHSSRDRGVSRRQCVRAKCPRYRASRSADRGTRARWTTPSARPEDDHRPGASRGSTSRKSFGSDWGSNGQPKPRYFGRASRASGQLTHRLLAKVCAGAAPFWPFALAPARSIAADALAGVSFVPFAARLVGRAPYLGRGGAKRPRRQAVLPHVQQHLAAQQVGIEFAGLRVFDDFRDD